MICTARATRALAARPNAIAKAIGPRLAATPILASPIEATSSQRRATIAIESGHEGAPARNGPGEEERRNRIRTGLVSRANPPRTTASVREQIFCGIEQMCWLENRKISRSAKVMAEAERAERAAKTARLRSLRMATQSDLRFSFPEELDCSLLIAALTQGEPPADRDRRIRV